MITDFERAFIEKVRSGETVFHQPNDTIRADILRRLLLGISFDDDRFASDSRITKFDLRGGKVTGELNLEDVVISFPVFVEGVEFDEPMRLSRSRFRSLSLGKSLFLLGLEAYDISVELFVFLNGVTANGQVVFSRARVGGDFDFDNCTINSDKEEISLDLSDAKIGGYASLVGLSAGGSGVSVVRAEIGADFVMTRAVVTAFGSDAPSMDLGVPVGLPPHHANRINEGDRALRSLVGVNFGGSTIGGNLDVSDGRVVVVDGGGTALGLELATIRGSLNCRRGVFQSAGGFAISANSVHVGGSVFFSSGFRAVGEVELDLARISRGIFCYGGEFQCEQGMIALDPIDSSERRSLAALRLCRAEVRGGLCLAADDGRPGEGIRSAQLDGVVDFSDCSVDVLSDNAAVWARVPRVDLEGFTYGRITEVGTGDRSWRKEKWFKVHDQWLQSPQPYEQLARTFRAAGKDHEARDVAIWKRDALAKSVVERFLRLSCGYGYFPWRPVLLSFALISLFWIPIALAERNGLMVPADGDVLVKTYETQRFHASSPRLLDTYPAFRAWLYSADVFVPIVDLQQERFWALGAVSGDVVRHNWTLWWLQALLTVEAILGFVMTSIIIASFSGLLRTD